MSQLLVSDGREITCTTWSRRGERNAEVSPNGHISLPDIQLSVGQKFRLCVEQKDQGFGFRIVPHGSHTSSSNIVRVPINTVFSVIAAPASAQEDIVLKKDGNGLTIALDRERLQKLFCLVEQ